MNQKTYNRLVEIARALKPKAQTGYSFHISALFRKGKILSIGVNNYNRQHLAHRFGEYYPTKFTASSTYRASLHSECSLAIRAGLEDWCGCEMVNIRIDNNGNPANSKPCLNCARVVKALAPKRVFFSVAENLFEEMEMG